MSFRERNLIVDATDQELLIRFAQTRDDGAFVALLQRYERMVWAVCCRVLRDEHLAEDALQGVFLILARQARGLSSRSESLASWLQTVATNTALQLRRSRIRSRRRELQRPLARETPLVELAGALDQELQGLHRQAREAVVLCYLQGLTQDEAARQLRVSKSTLRRRLDEGLVALRRRFARRGWLMPTLAVLWSTVASQGAEAGQPHQGGRELAEAVCRSLQPSHDPRSDFRLSQTSWNLCRRRLAMSRWNAICRWTVVGMLVCTLVGLGLWPVIAPSEAGEKAGVRPPRQAAKPKPMRGRAGDFRSLGAADQQEHVNAAKQQVEVRQAVAAGVNADQAVGKGLAAAGGGAGGMAQAGGQAWGNAQGVGGGLGQGFPTFPLLPGNGFGATVFSGAMNINGQEFHTNDPAEFQRLTQQHQGMFPQFPAAGKGIQVFHGVINNNGVVQEFDNAEDFEAAAPDFPLPVPGLK